MKIIAILLLTILSVSSLKMEHEVLAQITQDNEFGKAIVSMIQLTVQNTSPTGQLNAVRDLLAQLQHDLEQQQTIAAASNENRQAECDSTIAHLNEGIAALGASVEDVTNERNELIISQSEINAQVSDLRSQMDQAQQDLHTYQTQLAGADEVFQTQFDNFEEAVQSCDEAVRLLGQLAIQHASQATSFAQNGIIFVQMSQKFQSVKESLEKMESTTPSVLMKPIIDTLVQLGTKSKHIDLDQVQNLIELITSLRERIWSGQSLLETTHAQATQDLTTLVATLGEQITDHQARIHSGEQRLTSIQGQIVQKEKALNNAIEMGGLKQMMLTNTQTDCQLSADTYITMSTMRTNSLNVITELLNYFNDQIAAHQSE